MKRKLIPADKSTPEPPSKQGRLSDSFKVTDPKYISTDSIIKQLENNLSIDDTIKCEGTLVATNKSSDNKELVNQGTIGIGAVNESIESSKYVTISETYCTDQSELPSVSSVSNISLVDSIDDFMKYSKFTEENDSVMFGSETNHEQVTKF